MIRKPLARIAPSFFKNAYHAVEAACAALVYGLPGTRMYVVGITGTKGKTSTANLVWSVLTAGGFKTGLIGTANIRIGETEIANTMHMTMPGPWTTQKFLYQMRKAGCTHVIMEVTSEGLKQYRHIGIAFCAGIFTNLSPEHLASHGNSFEKYKKMKARLFAALAKNPEGVAIVNADDEHGGHYASFPVHRVIRYGLHGGEVQAQEVKETENGSTFNVNGQEFELNILGIFNIYNALPAIALGQELRIPYEKIRSGLAGLGLIPGRMERISEGQPYTVIVDYAHEKLSINALLDTATGWKKEEGKIITVIGAEGGGRDPAKREHMGRAAGVKSDYVIVTTTDPYDDDPVMLAEAVAEYVEQSGKERERTYFVIIERREAIRKALALAAPSDIVLFTGMGAQETMIMGGVALPWDERSIVRTEIRESLAAGRQTSQ